ncbi:MAG: RsmE family RNA methyltransferase, partial [Candidatus Uhrbacteria bacterium]|nr:RsmE family RNA methyltransferase [Candidatus Uhrbacteria bacterium]
MRTARFFVPEEWIARTAEAFTIPVGPIHKQIVAVLRMRIGDPISLMIDDGAEIDGHITEITRSAIMGVIAGSRVITPLRPDIIVCAAATKRDTFEWMLQKGTELGVNGFIPLLTDRVVKRPKDIPRRWLDIVREAAEQSGRVTLPVIYEPMTLAAAVGKMKDRTKIIMHEAAGEAKMPKTR